MRLNPARHAAALILLITLVCVSYSNQAAPDGPPQPPAAGQGTPPLPLNSVPAPAPQQDGADTSATPANGPDPNAPGELHISSLLLYPSGEPADSSLSLNDKLAVVLDGVPPHPADHYVLFLNDTEITGLEPAILTTLPDGRRALVYKLVRKSDNDAFWKDLLGSPKRFTIPVTVAIGERAAACYTADRCKPTEVSIRGVDRSKPMSFGFKLISGLWLTIAASVVAAMIGLVWGHARRSTTLRDSLIPQLPPHKQTYSLARWQMAFWFVLIFSSFVFLYVLLWDYNTVSGQALALMGISGCTALAAVSIDIAKDSPADAVNRALQALGLKSHEDVKRLKKEIEERKSQLPATQSDFDQKTAAAQHAKEAAAAAGHGKAGLKEAAAEAIEAAAAAERTLNHLKTQIKDRHNILRTYEDKTEPFTSKGWLSDLTTDLNGPTVHRVQVLCWTFVLGGIFVIDVYRSLTMPPDFSPTLLALMGLSSAGYVGFKYPEKNL